MPNSLRDSIKDAVAECLIDKEKATIADVMRDDGDFVCEIADAVFDVMGIHPDTQDQVPNEWYAVARWHADDLKDRRPDWSTAKCQAWLEANQNKIKDQMVEAGWNAIEILLDEEPDHESQTQETQTQKD